MQKRQMLSDHPVYLQAIEALEDLYLQHGSIPELISIRNLCRLVQHWEIPPPPLQPWVGTNTPKDKAVVSAYDRAFQDFTRDLDDEPDFEPWSD